MDSVDWIHLAHGTGPQAVSCGYVNGSSGSTNWRKCDSQMTSVFTEDFEYEKYVLSVSIVLLVTHWSDWRQAYCPNYSRPCSHTLSSSITSHSYFSAVIFENSSPSVHVYLINENTFSLPKGKVSWVQRHQTVYWNINVHRVLQKISRELFNISWNVWLLEPTDIHCRLGSPEHQTSSHWIFQYHDRTADSPNEHFRETNLR